MKKVAKIPKWFKSLEILVIKNLNGLRYIHDNLITPAFNFKGHQYKLITPNESYDWVAIYSTTTRQPIIGKLLMKDFHQGSIIIEHWKINDILSLHNRPVFERCHDHCLSNYSLASFYGCADKHWLKDAIIIYNVKIFSDDKMYVEALIDDIFSQAVLQWNRNRALIPYRYINPLEFVPPSNPILRYIKESSVNEILTDIQRKFRNYLHFDFYTDGSLINHKTEQSSMSCAFYQTNPLSPNTTFNTTLEYNPTSYKAEFYAIILALIVLPQNAICKIYTDNQTIIDNYERIDMIINYPRNFMKISSYPFWMIIIDLIKLQNISLKLFKVKSHSKDEKHDFVDMLAKEGHSTNNHITLTSCLTNTSFKYIPKILDIYIEKYPRKFLKDIYNFKNHISWINLHRNNKYVNLDIAWDFTYFYLNDEEEKSSTNFISSNIKAKKMKLLINELPTREQQKKSNPVLFEDWNCPLCNNYQETFKHVWVCEDNRLPLKSLRDRHITKLINLICYASGNDHVIDFRQIRKLPFFRKLYYSDFNFTFIDILKGIVPLILVEKINNIISDLRIVRRIVSLFLHELFIDFHNNIWKPRCEIAIQLEKLADIDNKKKKLKNRKNFIRSNIPITSISNSLNCNSLLDERIINNLTLGLDLGFYNRMN